jgi:hypothetical protein
MRGKSFVSSFPEIAVLTIFILIGCNRAFAHCDTLGGPVIKAAQEALETGNVNLVLIWVQKKDEAEIRKAFEKTLTVRKLSPEAKEIADMYFFETLVRIHRTGEGAPYTGLKPAGIDLGPAIPAADQAIEKGSVASLLKLLKDEIEKGIKDKFKETMAKKNFNKDDVEVGRDYIRSYVEFIHYAERLYEAAEKPAPGHFLEAEAVEEH